MNFANAICDLFRRRRGVVRISMRAELHESSQTVKARVPFRRNLRQILLCLDQAFGANGPHPLTPAFDIVSEPRVREHSQVFGHRLATHTGSVGQRPDGLSASLDQACDETEPGFVAQGPKEMGCIREH